MFEGESGKRRGQVMQGSVNHVKECDLYLKISGKPLKGYWQGSDLIGFIFRKITLAVLCKNELKKHKNVGKL